MLGPRFGPERAKTERHRGLDEATSPFSPAGAGLTSADSARHAASRHRPLHKPAHISVFAHGPSPQPQPAAAGIVYSIARPHEIGLLWHSGCKREVQIARFRQKSPRVCIKSPLYALPVANARKRRVNNQLEAKVGRCH